MWRKLRRRGRASTIPQPEIPAMPNLLDGNTSFSIIKKCQEKNKFVFIKHFPFLCCCCCFFRWWDGRRWITLWFLIRRCTVSRSPTLSHLWKVNPSLLRGSLVTGASWKGAKPIGDRAGGWLLSELWEPFSNLTVSSRQSSPLRWKSNRSSWDNLDGSSPFQDT